MGATTSANQAGDARWFYVWMAGTFVLIAFGGFVPTYWARLSQGTFTGAPILHIHGALFFTWTLFFLAQTLLVASGRTVNHRNWGLAGISLATAMGISVVLAAINMVRVAESIGMGEGALRFTIVSLSSLLMFAVLLWLAIANITRSEVHKRLMVLAMIPLMHAAMARLFMKAFAPPDATGPPPVFVAVPPGLFVDLLIVVAIIHDWRTRGRPHPVYLTGGAALLAMQLAMVPLSATPGWLAIATWIRSLAG
jgi:hypothetical protein